MKRAEEMTRLMETVETQQQAFHSFPQALGNLAHTARFPQSLSSDECERGGKPRRHSGIAIPLLLTSNGPSLERTKTRNTYYRCFPRPWVTSLSGPTETGLGYLIK
jgi:hypothetical protein